MLVQGAPYANTVLDAKASLHQQDLDSVLDLIESARERYEQAHRRILRRELGDIDELSKSDQPEARRLKQRQDRCHSVLAAFEEVIDTLGRMIRLRGSGKPLQESEEDEQADSTVKSLLRPSSAFRLAYTAVRTPEQQALAIATHFLVRTVDSPDDLETGALYFFYGQENTYLVILSSGESGQKTLPLQLALSGQQLKPISRTRFLESGRRRKLLRLVPRQPGDQQQPDALNLLSGGKQEEDSRAAPRGAEILDMGAFSQLHDAAMRSGLVPNADSITHARDREFRLGEYQKAFQLIEGLFGKFTAAAIQRDQRLRREDVDIASGRKKMSPKALMEKRARDTADTQRINRARGRFLRVLEGLRVLMRHSEKT